jgi:hypothetical protein
MPQQSDDRLSPAPITTPMLGIQGLPAQIWILWFQNIFKRLGVLTSESGTWTPTFASTSGIFTADGSWRSIGNQLFWQVVITATGAVDLTGGSFNLPIQAVFPSSLSAVRTDSFQDFGNGSVSGVTANLPPIVFSAGTVVLSGRYVR